MDIPDIWKLYKDESVWTYLGGSRNGIKAIKGIIGMIFPSSNCLYWTVRHRETKTFLGCISLTPHHDGESIEVSYEFLSSHWGQGYAYEAVSAVIEHTRLDTLVAETQVANTASRVLLAKLGFHEKERLTRFGAEQIIFIRRNHDDSST